MNQKYHEAECEQALSLVKKDSLKIALDQNGEKLSSEKLAKNLDIWQQNYSNIYFFIGGPDGLSQNIKSKADYLAFGAFYPSKTKKTRYQATSKILNKVKKITNIPIVAIGGINSSNYKNLLLNKANFLAISSYIWNNKEYKPKQAIGKLR